MCRAWYMVKVVATGVFVNILYPFFFFFIFLISFLPSCFLSITICPLAYIYKVWWEAALCVCRPFYLTVANKSLLTCPTQGRSVCWGLTEFCSCHCPALYPLHSDLPQLFQSLACSRSSWIPCPLWSSGGCLILVIFFFKARVTGAYSVLGTGEIKMNG